jgi:membrane-associated phospholipid phosphatase
MNDKVVIVKLKGIDWITLFFCTWMLVLIAIGWNRIHSPLSHFITYLSIITGILVLIWGTEFFKEFSKTENCHNGVCRLVRPRAFKLLLFIRSYYPVLLYLYFFESVAVTNRIFFHDWLDPFFMKIDFSIWGYQPSTVWGLKYSSYWLKELFHFAYFCYYPMIVGLPVLFYFKKRQALDEMVFVLSFVFYVCYFIFSWLPVIGGRFVPEAMLYTRQADAGIFTAIMAFIYSHSPHLGGAFPSSHIAVALTLSLMAFKYFRAVGYTFLFITFFLAIATVYCHYHWFIDAVCGIITGLGGFWLAQTVFKKITED